MRLLKPGEQETVSGELLIAGKKDCGSAVVIDRQGDYRFEKDNVSHWGYITEATGLITDAGMFMLRPGMYFSVPGNIGLKEGAGVVIRREGYRCLMNIGGPTEDAGRLRYIDGCTDTLLIGPPKLGDPCLNMLHFPKGIRQTMHTHPSLRCGTVVSGYGRAITPSGELPLTPGSCWFLDTNGQHCFYTDDNELTVIAWHPDSDTGPNDHDHPMLNKTIVDGVSAREIDEIRTMSGIII